MLLAWMAIPLTRGLYALVDNEDYERLSKYKWCAHKSGYAYYAKRATPIQEGKRRTILMHREVLGLPKGAEADHRNGCSLDNRKTNLRPATRSENNYNQFPRKNVSSRYKGVGWYKPLKKWRARIQFNKKVIHIAYFDDEVKAAKAYDRAAKKLFGEFAKTNF